MTSPQTTRRPGGRNARIGHDVLEATLKLLIDKGYPSLSLIAVAELAGVNRSTLYRRWNSRAEMALAAIHQTVRDNVIIEDRGSLADDLRALLLSIGKFIDGPAGHAVLTASLEMRQLGERGFDDGLSWKERAAEVLPIFARAWERGEISEDFDVEAGFAMLSGALYFRLIIMHDKPDRKWVDRVLDLFLTYMTTTQEDAP